MYMGLEKGLDPSRNLRMVVRKTPQQGYDVLENGCMLSF